METVKDQWEEIRSMGNTPVSVNLDAIQQELAGLDSGHSMEQISYHMTEHNSLPGQWWIFAPYGKTWPGQDPPPAPRATPYEQAILDLLDEARNQEKGRPCFIDMVHFWSEDPGKLFADQNPTIIDTLLALLDGAAKNPKPIVRYLVGFNQPKAPAEEGFLQLLKKKQLPDVEIYYGNFSPTLFRQFDGSPAEELIDRVLNGIWSLFKEEKLAMAQNLAASLERIQDVIQSHLAIVTSPIVCWNHAKIFAVNGSRMLTGGINFMDFYSTSPSHDGIKWDWIYDLQMRIDGDAAIDGHRYADYIWHYLNHLKGTQTLDVNSYGRRHPDWTTPATAPLFRDWKPVPSNAGTIKALTVANIGNWPNEYGIPALIVPALRDLVLNAYAEFAVKHSSGDTAASVIASACELLSDDNPSFRKMLRGLGVNPAMWASRYSRNLAVSKAQKVVRLSQQQFVMEYATENAAYDALRKKINDKLGINWNGSIWPFDALRAMAYGLANMSVTQDAGIQIICSNLECKSRGRGWGDSSSPKELKNKLALVMKGLNARGFIKVTGDIDQLINDRVIYKSVSDDKGDPARHVNHAKLTLVDDAVCNVSSDNAYPSYLPDLGVWIEDRDAIQSLLSGYWKPLWDHSFISSCQEKPRGNGTAPAPSAGAASTSRWR